MTPHWETVWTFGTKRFVFSLQITPCCDDPADSFQFEEDIEAVRNGLVDWFNARVVVLLDGREVGADYLSCCAYKKASDFITHGEGYFIDMVRSAAADARKALGNVPKLRSSGR